MSLPRFGGHPEMGYSPRIARGSKTVTEIAKELGVSPSMLHRWRERFEPELTGGAQPSQAKPSQGEREEVERLRSELIRHDDALATW
jgi:transposase-like protein